MLSIIIPTLNEEAALEETLSTLARKFNAIEHEIIVSDGKSKDRTVEIAKKYADKVIVHDGAARQNIPQGRNAGARAAKGDFLVFLDADVRVPEPDIFFAKAMAYFGGDAKLVALTAHLKVLPEMETFPDRVIFFLLNQFHVLMNNILHNGRASGEFQMIRASAFAKVGGYREDLAAGEDYDLFERLSKVGRTRIEKDLRVFHTGRRAHKIGWPKLLSTWLVNNVWLFMFKRVASKEWKPVR
jgi:glycosyltransferase involved in cell wall biosynthesis